jgi:hypothetical protein
VILEDAMSELRAICAGAQEMVEAAITYVYLPKLKLSCVPAALDGLLCVQQHSGYATRLFLSAEVPGKGNNWSAHQILGKTWYTWSWKDVSADLRPAEILLGHLDALR